jgi:hypothetical protein
MRLAIRSLLSQNCLNDKITKSIYDVATPILRFRHFMELVQEKPGYMNALGQLGITPDDVANNPQYLGNATMGKFTYSGVTYQIVKLLKGLNGQVTGAVIKPLEAQPQGVYLTDKSGKKVRSPENTPGPGGVVDIDTLNKMLNQETPAAGQAPAAGATPALPPGAA